MLVAGVGVADVVVGYDFCFGKGRKGTADDLQAYGADMSFGVTVAPASIVAPPLAPPPTTRRSGLRNWSVRTRG